jgi:bacterial/archaeal transporter family protein
MKSWILYAIISMLFAGVTSVIAKFGMKNVTGDTALAIRTTMVFGLIWINVLLFGRVREMSMLSRNDILFLCLSGVTTTLSWLFYYRAIKDGNVSVVAGIDKASVVITILLSLTILKEPLSSKLLIGAVLIIAGTLVLIWK